MAVVLTRGLDGARRLACEATGFGQVTYDNEYRADGYARTPNPRTAAKLRELRLRDGSVDELVALAHRRDPE